MAREMVRRRVVGVSAVAILGLALVGALLAIMNSQVAFAKTNQPGAMRQTGDTTGMTGTTGAMMSYSDMESTGQAMMHLLLALHAVNEMKKDQMSNPSMMMGNTGSTTATTDTTGTTAGTGTMMSGADVGGLLEVLGHTAESMGYMHEAMSGMSGMMGATGNTATGNTMTGGMADLTPMLDILDQMVQATTDQVNGMTGGTDMSSTGAITDTTGTGTTGTTTDTTGTGATGSDMTGMMGSGSINSSALLPDMAQTLQAMSTQLRSMMDNMNGMTGGTDMGSSNASTDTTGTGTTGSSDMMGIGTPSTRQSFQAMGMALELMGDIHKMIAMNHMMGTGMTGTTDSTTGSTGDTSSMTGLISDLAQAMSDQLNTFTGGMGGDMMGSGSTGSTDTGATGTTTDTTGTGATGTTTDTTGTGATGTTTDTTGTGSTTGSNMMGMGSSNDVLSSAAQLAQTLLDQIRSAAGGTGGTNSQ